MMSMIAATIASYSFGIEGSCYTMKTSLPKMSNLALRLLVHARHTTDAGARLHFGCTATDEPLITLQTGPIISRIKHWRLHWVHIMLITPLDLKSCTRLTRGCMST